MSGGGAPAAPNYSGLIQAANDQSARYAKIMDEQLQFAKDAYDHQLPYSDKVQDAQYESLTDSNAFAKSQRAQYQNLYQPLAEQFVDEAKDYTSEDKMARARGAAMGAVGQTFDAAGDAAKRSLESYGIDPSATRYAALDVGARTAKAAATAAAGTKSDVDREATGLGLQTAALNIGNGLPGQVSALTNTGTAAGAAGVGAGNSTYSAVAPALGNPAAWGGMSTNALGMAGSLTGQQYAGQMQQYGANQSSSSGIGSLLGAALGGAKMFLMEDGGAVPEEAVPMAGGIVPPEMSPSGGMEVDDVPAQVGPAVGQVGPPPGYGGGPATARINAGEFVLPEDVTRWLGEEKLQKLILKARQDAGQAGAQPEMKPAVGSGAQLPPPEQAGALPINPQPEMPHMARGGRVPAVGARSAGRFAGGASRLAAVGGRPERALPWPGGSNAGAIRTAVQGV